MPVFYLKKTSIPSWETWTESRILRHSVRLFSRVRLSYMVRQPLFKNCLRWSVLWGLKDSILFILSSVSELQGLKNAFQIQYLIWQVLKVRPFQQAQTALDHESSAVLWVSFRLFYCWSCFLHHLKNLYFDNIILLLFETIQK